MVDSEALVTVGGTPTRFLPRASDRGGEYGKQAQFIEPAEIGGTPFLRAVKRFLDAPVLTSLVGQRFAVPSFHCPLPFPRAQVWP